MKIEYYYKVQYKLGYLRYCQMDYQLSWKREFCHRFKHIKSDIKII